MSRIPDNDELPGGFARPGVVSISPTALELAKQYRNEIVRTKTPGDWVVCFDWATSRRARRPQTNEWFDLGAGFDLSSYERSKVPTEAVQVVDGLEFLVKISVGALRSSKRRLIETDTGVRTHLALR